MGIFALGFLFWDFLGNADFCQLKLIRLKFSIGSQIH